jgi:hypothetical protein
MNRKTVQVLAAIIVGLVLALLVLDSNDDSDIVAGRPLLPELRTVANTATQVTIQGPDAGEVVTILRNDDGWTVSTRDNYAADVGKLRQLIIALADANIIEEKTSNPEQYEKLGVGDPVGGGKGSRVTISGPDYTYAVILGSQTQGKFRYARIDGAQTSYLIDKDPTLPLAADDWLSPDILDIGAARVQRVSITHADGEVVVIAKDTQEQTDFVVLDVPHGRELSYATVANGIGGALAGLKLEDVRARVEAAAATIVKFDLWDGFSITAEVVVADDQTWISFAAAVAGDEASAAEEVATINGRLGGWQYRIPDYKKNLLVRRWDDILKTAD